MAAFNEIEHLNGKFQNLKQRLDLMSPGDPLKFWHTKRLCDEVMAMNQEILTNRYTPQASAMRGGSEVDQQTYLKTVNQIWRDACMATATGKTIR